MDLDLKAELRLNLKRQRWPAFVQLDDEGYWLVIEHHGAKTRIPLPDDWENSILLTHDDVSGRH